MKKQLLNESEVRKLMKFANLSALSENFVENLEEEDEMTPVEEVMGDPLDDQEPEALEPPEESDEDMPPEDDMPMDVEGGEEDITAEVTIGQDEAHALMGLLGQLEDAVGVEGAGEEDLGAGEEVAMAPEEGEDEIVAEAEEELEESDVHLYEDDDIVNEVTRRVAKRLMAAKRRS